MPAHAAAKNHLVQFDAGDIPVGTAWLRNGRDVPRHLDREAGGDRLDALDYLEPKPRRPCCAGCCGDSASTRAPSSSWGYRAATVGSTS